MENSEPILDCNFFNVLENMSIERQIEWLKGNEIAICSDHTQCVAASHELNADEIQEVEIQRDFSNQIVVKLREIIIDKKCSYDEYARFQVDSNNIIVMDFVQDFSSDNSISCYSMPLFFGIQKRYNNVDLDTNFTFFRAQIGSYNTIVFIVDGVTNGYFDYSRWPKLFPEKSPL